MGIKMQNETIESPTVYEKLFSMYLSGYIWRAREDKQLIRFSGSENYCWKSTWRHFFNKISPQVNSFEEFFILLKFQVNPYKFWRWNLIKEKSNNIELIDEVSSKKIIDRDFRINWLNQWCRAVCVPSLWPSLVKSRELVSDKHIGLNCEPITRYS